MNGRDRQTTSSIQGPLRPDQDADLMDLMGLDDPELLDQFVGACAESYRARQELDEAARRVRLLRDEQARRARTARDAKEREERRLQDVQAWQKGLLALGLSADEFAYPFPG